MTDRPDPAATGADDAVNPEFHLVRRGYDPDEVEDLLDELYAEIAEARATIARLEARPREGGGAAVTRSDLDELGVSVSAVLEAAVREATGLRERTAREAEEVRAAADAYARERRAAADRELTEVRSRVAEARVHVAALLERLGPPPGDTGARTARLPTESGPTGAPSVTQSSPHPPPPDR